MAAATVITIIQLVEAAIPGFTAVLTAIRNLKQNNSDLTAAQITTLVQGICTNVGNLDADTLATLSQIPAAPAATAANKSAAVWPEVEPAKS
jgi:hypothetical protein